LILQKLFKTVLWVGCWNAFCCLISLWWKDIKLMKWNEINGLRAGLSHCDTVILCDVTDVLYIFFVLVRFWLLCGLLDKRLECPYESGAQTTIYCLSKMQSKSIEPRNLLKRMFPGWAWLATCSLHKFSRASLCACLTWRRSCKELKKERKKKENKIVTISVSNGVRHRRSIMYSILLSMSDIASSHVWRNWRLTL
jgi:hypothetical protein